MYNNLSHLPKPRITERRIVTRTRNFIDVFEQGKSPFFNAIRKQAESKLIIFTYGSHLNCSVCWVICN